MQTSIYRPRFLAFEDGGGVLPAHATGFWATGKAGLGSGKVKYDAVVYNGSRLVDNNAGTRPFNLDMNLLYNEKRTLSFMSNLGYEFGGSLEGLSVGAHGYTMRVNYAGNATNGFLQFSIQSTMFGGYLVYDGSDLEFMSELYRIGNKNILTPAQNTLYSTLGYAQVGYYLFDRFKLFYRFEQTSENQRDLYFNYQDAGFSYARNSVGAKFDVSPKAALKGECFTTHQYDVHTSNVASSVATLTPALTPVANYGTCQMQFAVRF